jgi:hypothetical protein
VISESSENMTIPLFVLVISIEAASIVYSGDLN